MKPTCFGRVVCAMFALALAAPLWAQSFTWWKSDQFQKDLGLSADQTARIGQVFQTTMPRLRQTKEELDRAEAELSKLIESNVDEAPVLRQIDKVEATRGQLNKMRTLMLLHMRQVLTSEQRVKFKTLHEQWERDHHRPRPPAGDERRQ